MSERNLVQEHYTFEDLPARVENALLQAGLGSGEFDWSEVALLDQFHIRGLAATKELAEGLNLAGGESVLDIGSGLGGPARYLAAIHGCQVTGIELTQPFIVVADLLSLRTGLSHRLRFLQGDALDLPFPPDSFDHAWTQHVAMNIEDKERLYTGIHKVLKKGGRLAIYDVVKGEVEPLIYPVPWAREAAISFLASPSEMMLALRAAGFREVSAVDTTDIGLTWLANLQRQQPESGSTNTLTLASVMGPDMRQMVMNVAQNIKEGRARLMQVIVQKD
jgi:ubiquinone/menaquinone biosynthesis C-methylase UbiE